MHDYAIDIVLSIYIMSLGYVPPPGQGPSQEPIRGAAGYPRLYLGWLPMEINVLCAETTPIFYKGVARLVSISMANLN